MGNSYKQNQVMLDPILQSLPHLIFQETDTKIIATIKKNSQYYCPNFRTFAYKSGTTTTDTKNSLANDFFYRNILK